jgi:uncharacterized protein
MPSLPRNAINWFDIPVHDIARARAFYSTVLGNELTLDESQPGFPMAMFPVADATELSVGGALVPARDGQTPGPGTTVYLDVADLDASLSRVEAAGGQIAAPAFDTPWGRMAFIVDTEGNRVGLHAYQLQSG